MDEEAAMFTRLVFFISCSISILLVNVVTPSLVLALCRQPQYDVGYYREIIKEQNGADQVVRAYMTIGIMSSYYLFHEYQAAEDAYRHVIKDFPNSPYVDDARWYLARLSEWNIEDFDKAIVMYKEIIAVSGGVHFEENPYYGVKFVEKDLNAADVPQIIKSIEEKQSRIIFYKDLSEQKGDKDWRLYFQLAEAYAAIGALQHAEQALNTVIQKYASTPDVLALAHLEIGKLYSNQWIDRLEDPLAKRLFGNDEYTCMGEPSHYTELLREALVHYGIVFTKYQRNYCDRCPAEEALFEAGKAYSKIGYKWERDNFTTSDMYREIRGDHRNAIDMFERLLREYPHSHFEKEAIFELGQSYRQIGETKRAREVLKSLVQRFPDSEQAKRASMELNQKW